jgi:hypothetical protein
MRIGIVGSRTFDNYELLVNTLSIFAEGIDVIVSGGAQGADSLAAKYANDLEVDCLVLKPDWDKNGKSAGFIRNQQIVDASDMIIAFWDGKSKGTEDLINKARIAKKPTFIIYF